MDAGTNTTLSKQYTRSCLIRIYLAITDTIKFTAYAHINLLFYKNVKKNELDTFFYKKGTF